MCGDRIFSQGDIGTNIYYLKSGKIKVIRSEENGGESLLNIHNPGSIFGLSALTIKSIRNVNCIALGNVKLVSINKMDLLEKIMTDGNLCLEIMQLLLWRIQHFQARISVLSVYDVEKRIVKTLLDLGNAKNVADASEKIPVILSHEELASLVSASRPAVSTKLKHLESLGFISLSRRCIRLTDIQALDAIIAD